MGGALLPVDAPGDARALIEQIVEVVGMRVSAPREAHHREGHEMFTVDAVIAEEERVFARVDAARAHKLVALPVGGRIRPIPQPGRGTDRCGWCAAKPGMDMLLPRDIELVGQRHGGHNAAVADNVGAGEIPGPITGTER